MLRESCLGRVGLAVGKPLQCLLVQRSAGKPGKCPVDIGGQWLFKTDITHLGLVKTETLSALSAEQQEVAIATSVQLSKYPYRWKGYPSAGLLLTNCNQI